MVSPNPPLHGHLAVSLGNVSQFLPLEPLENSYLNYKKREIQLWYQVWETPILFFRKKDRCHTAAFLFISAELQRRNKVLENYKTCWMYGNCSSHQVMIWAFINLKTLIVTEKLKGEGARFYRESLIRLPKSGAPTPPPPPPHTHKNSV